MAIAKQVKVYGPKEFTEGGRKYRITARVRHDDECKNGHNSFAITGDIDCWNGYLWEEDSGGCIHDEIRTHFPELAPFIKWHLTSTDEPMHYVANALYWLGWCGFCDPAKHNSPPNLEHAREAAVWPELPASFICPDPNPDWLRHGQPTLWEPERLRIEQVLKDRLPALMAEFKRDVLSLGLEF
jgi:hypothetical protein